MFNFDSTTEEFLFLSVTCLTSALLFKGNTRMASNYAKRMVRLSARIFGEVARPTNEKSMKVVRLFSEKPIEQNREVTEYYPRHVELDSLMKRLRYLGLFRDEHQDFKDEMKRLRALRGKAKPKKGEGKRAQKRK